MARLFVSVIVLGSVASVVAVRPAPAQSVPVNAIGVNFSPLTTSMSYNYDWSTGTLTLGTATGRPIVVVGQDRKSTRLNSSHVAISYAVCCLKKKTTNQRSYAR